jgi:hypothetical protein
MLRTSKILILLLILIGLQISFSQNLKKSFYKNSLRNDIFELQSNKLKLFVEDVTGKYYIKTIDDKNILYYDTTRTDFFTSHLNLKIDDSVYSNDANLSKTTLTPQLNASIKIDTNFAAVEYNPKNGKINIIQKLIPADYYGMGALICEVTITNKDKTAHSIGSLMEFDLQVNKNDGANLKTNTGPIIGDTVFSGSKVPFFWRAYEKQNSDTNFIVQSQLTGRVNYSDITKRSYSKTITAPDMLIFDEWEKLYNIAWDYNPNNNIPFSDGAVIFRWNQRALLPDSSITFTVIISESHGAFSNGKLIVNSFTMDKLSYNGNRYEPDPLPFYTMIFNNSAETIQNISSSIVLPYGLFTDTIAQKVTPDVLLPYETGFVKYNLHPKMSAGEKLSLVNTTINSSTDPNSCPAIILIPAAADADTLDPDVSITQKNCSFWVKISENRKNDKGIDSLCMLTSENMIYTYDQFKKGDTSLNISGSLQTAGKRGVIRFRVYDLAGNISEFSIVTEPDIIGFDNELVGSGNSIFVPFKIKSKNLLRIDTVMTCKIKYDPLYMNIASTPIEIQRDQKANIVLSEVKTENNTLSFKLSCKNGFDVGTLALLQFNVLSNVKDSTLLVIQDLVLNQNQDYCIYKSNSSISFNTPDKSAPKITLQQFGSRFFGTVTDNGINDRGIYNIFLSNSTNATLLADTGAPGKKDIKIVIAATDSSKSVSGSLTAVDGSGNISSFFFQFDPVLIKADTMKAASKSKILFTPVIYGELPDITLHEYSFGISYDTSILKPASPYYNKSGSTGSDYTVICDTTTKGKIKVSASGVSFLTLGKVLNLLFEIKPGKDTVSKIQFDYFYLKNGLKAVYTTDGIVFRINNDTTAPVISYYQKRKQIFIQVTESNQNDLGIDSVKIEQINNLSVQSSDKSESIQNYILSMADSTKNSGCSVYAVDIIGNNSRKFININPVKLFLPDSLRLVTDSVSVPVYLMPSSVFKLTSINFKLKIDQDFFVNPDTIRLTTNELHIISASYDRTSSFLTFSSKENLSFDSTAHKLFTLNLKTKTNNKTNAKISFSDININNDSLFAYGNYNNIFKPVTDTTAPDIKITPYACEYNVDIKDKGGIAFIKIDSLKNIRDTLLFKSPFKNLDTSAAIKVLPLDYTKESKFIIIVSDSLGNISKKTTYINPINASLPLKTKIYPHVSNGIPIILSSAVPSGINSLLIRIKYDENIAVPDTNIISVAGSILDKANTTITLLPPNSIRITATNIIRSNSLILFNLNLSGKEGDSLVSNISIENLSINNDSVCSYITNGLLYRSKSNKITVSVEPNSKGQIGKEVLIPVYISGDYINYNFTGIRIYLSFNPTLLKPVIISASGTGLEGFNGVLSYDHSGKLLLSYSGNNSIAAGKPLTAFTSNVLLGDMDSTTIKIDSFKYDYTNNISAPQITLESGIFNVTGKFEWQEGLNLKKDYLYQNQPNPYNSTTVILFTLKNSGAVKLTVYDILGREVLGLVNGFLESGEHRIFVKSDNLPSGVYYYHLKTDSYSQVRKMVLLK